MGLDITGIGSIFDFGSKVLDKIFPDPTEAAKAKAALEIARQSGALQEEAAVWENAKGQIATNTAEATSSSLWVSGWRPYVGWICGTALAYASIISPLMAFIHDPSHPPAIDTTVTLQVLFGLLGLGGLRTFERIKGAIPPGK